MKFNLGNFHKLDSSTHKQEERKNLSLFQGFRWLVDIFSGVVCKLMTIMTIPLGGAAWAGMAGRSHV